MKPLSWRSKAGTMVKSAPMSPFSSAMIALLPCWLIVLVAYLGTMVWTVVLSFTSSRSFPTYDFVKITQYERLFRTSRWLVSLENLFIFGVLFIVGCLIIGFLLAILLDSNIRGQGLLRTVFLYPHAMSFIVTGAVWQWMLNPAMGIEASVRLLGFPEFSLDLLGDSATAIYVVVAAGIWQAVGVTTVILLAGLRSVDADIWKATRIDAVPTWQVYLRIILPMLKPMVATSVVLLGISVVRSYDLIVALTSGGPGISTEVPAKFAMDHLFNRQNIGLATAATVVILGIVLMLVVPATLYKRWAVRLEERGH
ncbi:carbohydrate ABC transporter permease [Rhizobium leguminosarum]|uniref:carbohydrate ABC transporter permease n=1 Tax=Rhizobium leguminosarum TaxID=384 RepID=UPI001FF041B0|nr:sugar ABC transporter permease [Rhizobium leguminosarum]